VQHSLFKLDLSVDSAWKIYDSGLGKEKIAMELRKLWEHDAPKLIEGLYGCILAFDWNLESTLEEVLSHDEREFTNDDSECLDGN
jgi:hypothetical protein